MIENFKGKPVGISALATSIGENPETIEEVYEPFSHTRRFYHSELHEEEKLRKSVQTFGNFEVKKYGSFF